MDRIRNPPDRMIRWEEPSFHVGDRGGGQDPLLKDGGDLARGGLGTALQKG